MMRQTKLIALVAILVTLGLIGIPSQPPGAPASAARLAPIPAFLRMPAHWTHAGISAELTTQVRRLTLRFHSLASPHAPAPRLTILVTSAVDLSGAIRRLGGSVDANIRGHVFVARLPADRIARLANTRGALSIELSHPITPQLDVSVPETRANQVWSLPAPGGGTLQGNHVLVGVVDSGIDYRDPDFQNPDGSTRIKFIWDQTQDGHAPIAEGFNTGYECDSASINSGQCPEKDMSGHGTHVIGVATSNGRAASPAKEIGVAPQADIAVVKYNSTAGVLQGWQYLVKKAQELHEPLVVNTSLGLSSTPRDGTSATASALDLLAGPGDVFVESAGNTGHQRLHADTTVAQGQTTSISFEARPVKSPNHTLVQLDAYFPNDNQVTATLTNTDTGESWGPAVTGAKFVTNSPRSKDGTTIVDLYNGDYSPRWHQIFVNLEAAPGVTGLSGHYRLDLTGVKITDSGRVDAWLGEEQAGQFSSNIDESTTLTTPADAAGVISVASYIARSTFTGSDGQSYSNCGLVNGAEAPTCDPSQLIKAGDLAPSSASGPTQDGRQKPDLAAPGQFILSSLSRDVKVCGSASDTNCLPKVYLSPDGKYYYGSGTSDSAPFVAGTIALMLQQDPYLDNQQVDAILRSTTRHGSWTGPDA